MQHVHSRHSNAGTCDFVLFGFCVCGVLAELPCFWQTLAVTSVNMVSQLVAWFRLSHMARAFFRVTLRCLEVGLSLSSAFCPVVGVCVTSTITHDSLPN